MKEKEEREIKGMGNKSKGLKVSKLWQEINIFILKKSLKILQK